MGQKFQTICAELGLFHLGNGSLIDEYSEKELRKFTSHLEGSDEHFPLKNPSY
jgi:hypothetical protein